MIGYHWGFLQSLGRWSLTYGANDHVVYLLIITLWYINSSTLAAIGVGRLVKPLNIGDEQRVYVNLPGGNYL